MADGLPPSLGINRDADDSDNDETCQGNDGECSRDVSNKDGNYCWQHP